MSQVSSMAVPNGSGLSVRTGINAVLEALASCSSGGTAPANPQAGQLWFDTATGQLKQRNATNAAWLVLVFAGRKISADGPGLSGFGDLSADRTAVLNLGALPDKTAAEYVGPHFVVTNGAVAKSQAKMTVVEAKKALGIGSLGGMEPTGTPDISTFLRGDGAWASPSAPYHRVFTASGTWTKPEGYQPDDVFQIEGWGGGGGGRAGSGGAFGGGGGGAYFVRLLRYSEIPDGPIPVAVGAGGAASGFGGASSVGTLFSVNGGGPPVTESAYTRGGHGGALMGLGYPDGGLGGEANPEKSHALIDARSQFGGGGGASSDNARDTQGGNAIFGGGGGRGNGRGLSRGGASVYGGNGGSVQGGAGEIPGGGGAFSGGVGGRGEVRITKL